MLHSISFVKLVAVLLWHASYYRALGAECNSVEVSKDFCANPKPPDTPFDLDWANENAEKGWNVQFGNPIGRQFFKKLIRGTQNDDNISDKDDDYSEMCLRLNFNFNGGFGGYYSGYGGKQATFSCAADNCTYTSPDKLQDFSVTGYSSYFDAKDHNLLTAIFCFDNGDVGWFAMTGSKTISEEQTNTMIEHFKSLGFNPELRVPYRHPSC